MPPLSEQGGGFHGAEALLAERAAQGIDLAHDFAEGVVGAGRAAAHGKIASRENAGRTQWSQFHANPYPQPPPKFP
jgi:hypothetical protein